MNLRSSFQSLRSLFVAGTKPSKRRRKAPAGRARRCALEMLEPRRLMAGLAADFSALNPYGVFAMSGAQMSITNPQTSIGGSGGNVGLGPNAVQNFSDGKIAGSLIVDLTANNTHKNNVKIGTGTYTGNLSGVNADALNASQVIAAMKPTKTLGNITDSTTLVSVSGIQPVNVIQVNSLQLDGSSTLTLNGPYNSYFFVDVTGKFAMTGSSRIIETGGVPENHVIFNIVGTGEQVAFTGKSDAAASFLAVNRDISVSGSTVEGAIIGGMNHQIAITSAATVQSQAHFQPPSCM